MQYRQIIECQEAGNTVKLVVPLSVLCVCVCVYSCMRVCTTVHVYAHVCAYAGMHITLCVGV